MIDMVKVTLLEEIKTLQKELKDLKKEYKELFKESEAVAQSHGGLILLVEDFVDKAKEMI